METECYVADLLALPGRDDILRVLILQCVERSQELGATSVSAGLLQGHAYANAFRNLAFVELPWGLQKGKVPLALCNRNRREDIEEVMRKQNKRIHMTLADTDWI